MAAKKFLVVDDDLEDSELFSEAILAVDSTVACLNASHGKEALDKLQEKGIQTPDIIFLDINMPVMDGWQFLARIKQNQALRAIPVIVYSTSSRRSDRNTAMSSGALCFFTKPDSYTQLKKILRVVVQHMDDGELDKVCEAITKTTTYP